jgi:magnesium transporter
VYDTDDQETVVQVIRKYDAVEAAVIDKSGQLLGRITHDDLLDVADEEAEEDLFRMAGTDAAELDTHSVFHAARIRLTWLLPCMFGMLLSATVLNFSAPHFDLALFAALALFVPMIGATGGNSGIQISTVIVRGFATGDVGSTKLVRALLREGRIALAMAPVCGVLAWALVNLFFPVFSWLDPAAEHLAHPGQVALAVGSAMTTAIIVAAGLGIALPFSFRRLGVDPAIASGPLVTTMNDVVSVSIYMSMAMFMTR